jgi:hypothetical protein
VKRTLIGALLLACSVGLVSALPACNKLQAAAAQDPMKCERDPKCDKKRGRTADCSRQCNDDPACVDRCEQVQQSNGSLGH